MPPRSSRARSTVIASVTAVTQLPTVDVRSHLDERAARGWNESWRRMVRVAVLMASDVGAGLLGVLTVRLTWELVSSGGRRPVPDEVPLLAMVFCLMPLALRVVGAYAAGGVRTDAMKIGAGVALAALLGWVQAQLFGRDVPNLPNKTAYAYSILVITSYVCMARALMRPLVNAGYRRGLLQRRMLMVGSQAEADELNRLCQATACCELRIIGRLDPDSPVALVDSQHPTDVPYVGRLESLGQALSRTGAHGLIVSSGLPFARLETVVYECFRHRATVAVLPHTLKNLSATQIEVRQSAVGSLLQLRPVHLDVPQLALKRLLDIALTLLALFALWPVLAIVSLVVKLDSKGPLLFRQTRVGQGGRTFEILKFRTMVVDAESQKADLQHLNEYADARLFKIRNDPRITRVGCFLRKSSLDELPQLWNVLRGEMSLVGPRPCVPEELTQYLPHHLTRLFVLPGVTGPWQVSGRNEIRDFEEVVRLEREYIEHWSLFTDLVILARTVPALLGRGAY
jgi:exopolysaccharide biosynthesis polyprenyl glycosylphosphotransferase